ncbi:hypothetical protein TSTA_042900 [Talaromyces stipitatus ATCC 10500]|uniref:Xylanolytic transcriptional activator regulatory domain-containing protein n=1 Tax=Talaromyces stipitatus (strain ATCC 10500 / CBS 375.48 / QM 6759 / NRRL 1006) TaxID=441959 RepID=B8MK01_TALSN|nr:uncharacterized protein TSTA_042900 [Talaromyces stipitatus ATCC 10500]EED14818.1 hypothetical protein TSTA_042900 [Talaromyces stipitatus ATCC 10500]
MAQHIQQIPSSVKALNSTVQAPLFQGLYSYKYNNNRDLDYDKHPEYLHQRGLNAMSQKIQQLHYTYYIRAYYQYFHDAHPLLLPLTALEGPLGTQHIPRKLTTVMQYIGSHFLTINTSPREDQSSTRGDHRRAISDGSIQSNNYEEKANRALEEEAFSCLSHAEEEQDGYQVQCMLLLSITAHAHGNFLEAIRLIKSTASLALNLGMHTQSFAVAHGHGSPMLEEMWRRCYWELFVVESLLCALVEESATLYEVGSDIPLPCDEGMMDVHISTSSTYKYTIQDLLDHCNNRAQLVDPLPSFAYRITAAHFLGSVLSLRPSCKDATTANELEKFYPKLMEHVDHKASIGGIGAQPDHIAQMLSQTKVIACSAMIYFYRQTSKLTPIKLQRNLSPDPRSPSYPSTGPSTPVFPSSFILHSKLSTTSTISNSLHSKLITSDPSSMHLISTAKQLATQLNNPRLVRGNSPLIIDAIALAMLVEMAALLLPTLDGTLRERLSNEFGNSLGVLKKFAARWPLAKTVRDLLIDEYENLFRPERAR